jgi:hypothetical protein
MSRKFFFIALFLSNSLLSEVTSSLANDYIFGWMFNDLNTNLNPRGGTTKGPDSILSNAPSKQWLALQESGLSKFEKDRRAILALIGEYRVSFDFLEIDTFSKENKASQPYQSWATEFVYLIEDRKSFISLQHVLVMFFESIDGSISGPMVTKHWRQDWHYQDYMINEFKGNNTWSQTKLPFHKTKGGWSQSVYQVDDSPRYQSIGKWEHFKNSSSWLSDTTWRPLPRREFTIRNDYDVLIGTNKQTITPNGWVHEQSNSKSILVDDSVKVIAREIGLSKYQRIESHDWSAGEEYVENTFRFWKIIRDEWNKILNRNNTIKVKQSYEGQALYESMFIMAEKTAGAPINEENENIIKDFLSYHIDIVD